MKITKNKNQYFSYLQKQFSKFAVVLVVVSMLFGTLGINQTSAYFTSSATVSGNTFTAGILAFHLNPSTDFTPSALNKGDTASLGTTIVKENESLGFQYTVATTDMPVDNALCNYLTLQATNGAYTYNDSLSGFSAPVRSYDASAWNFSVTLPSGASNDLQDMTCNFKFTFNGWQEGLLSTQGFSDTKQINGTITSGHWVAPVNSNVVLNEILPNPEGLDTQHGLQGEWVELYNNGDTSIDLAGWKIKDAANHEIIISSTNTMDGRTLIGAKGSYLEWVVVFMNDDILNNGGDTVSFYDNTGALVDQYTYVSSVNDTNSDSNSTGGASNSNPSGSETARNEGKSDARIPDGADNWVDPIPTPGMPNELGDVIIPAVDTTEVVTPAVDTATEDNSADTIESAPADTTTDESVTDTTTDGTVTTDNTEATDATVTDDTTATTDDDTTTIQSSTETSTVDTPAVDTSANEIK